MSAQELNCIVKVNDSQVQTTERNIFRDMEVAFAQFLNNTKWTNDVFQPEERINCNLSITIESMPSIGNFTATVQVQSVRPIFDTNYESLTMNFADRDWAFSYTEQQPLDYLENSFSSNLVSMLSFYAYVVLGLDYDSFSNLGGDMFFNKALDLVNIAQQSGSSGWQPFDSNRNRYWLIENLTNQQMSAIREGYYKYYRLGLDRFNVEPDAARLEILNVLKEIEKVKNLKPNAIIVISFFDAKSDELINIFSEGNIQVRRDAYNILSKVDPTKTERYKKIIQN